MSQISLWFFPTELWQWTPHTLEELGVDLNCCKTWVRPWKSSVWCPSFPAFHRNGAQARELAQVGRFPQWGGRTWEGVQISGISSQHLSHGFYHMTSLKSPEASFKSWILGGNYFIILISFHWLWCIIFLSFFPPHDAYKNLDDMHDSSAAHCLPLLLCTAFGMEGQFKRRGEN